MLIACWPLYFSVYFLDQLTTDVHRKTYVPNDKRQFTIHFIHIHSRTRTHNSHDVRTLYIFNFIHRTISVSTAKTLKSFFIIILRKFKLTQVQRTCAKNSQIKIFTISRQLKMIIINAIATKERAHPGGPHNVMQT